MDYSFMYQNDEAGDTLHRATSVTAFNRTRRTRGERPVQWAGHILILSGSLIRNPDRICLFAFLERLCTLLKLSDYLMSVISTMRSGGMLSAMRGTEFGGAEGIDRLHRVIGQSLDFRPGEYIHTTSAYKFREFELGKLAEDMEFRSFKDLDRY